jgi:hypothetical protein
LAIQHLGQGERRADCDQQQDHADPVIAAHRTSNQSKIKTMTSASKIQLSAAMIHQKVTSDGLSRLIDAASPDGDVSDLQGRGADSR